MILQKEHAQIIHNIRTYLNTINPSTYHNVTKRIRPYIHIYMHIYIHARAYIHIQNKIL